MQVEDGYPPQKKTFNQNFSLGEIRTWDLWLGKWAP